jgi:hypothetical protein
MLPEQLEAGGGCGVVRLEGAPDGSGRACGEETSAFTVASIGSLQPGSFSSGESDGWVTVQPHRSSGRGRGGGGR